MSHDYKGLLKIQALTECPEPTCTWNMGFKKEKPLVIYFRSGKVPGVRACPFKHGTDDKEEKKAPQDFKMPQSLVAGNAAASYNEMMPYTGFITSPASGIVINAFTVVPWGTGLAALTTRHGFVDSADREIYKALEFHFPNPVQTKIFKLAESIRVGPDLIVFPINPPLSGVKQPPLATPKTDLAVMLNYYEPGSRNLKFAPAKIQGLINEHEVQYNASSMGGACGGTVWSRPDSGPMTILGFHQSTGTTGGDDRYFVPVTEKLLKYLKEKSAFLN